MFMVEAPWNFIKVPERGKSFIEIDSFMTKMNGGSLASKEVTEKVTYHTG